MFGPGIDQPISLFRDGENYYYHSDALGSVYQMTDSDEAVVKSYDYSAFGKIISETGSLPFNNPFTYTAREYDSESGLYYYRARYYDAEVGRFISHDPEYWLGGINLYIYVSNNPVNKTDPLGLREEDKPPSIWKRIWFGFVTAVSIIIPIPAAADKNTAPSAAEAVHKKRREKDAFKDLENIYGDLEPPENQMNGSCSDPPEPGDPCYKGK